MKMDLRTKVAVSGRARSHEEQRIFVLHRVIVKVGFEELVSISELRAELIDHLFTHRITTLRDTWPDGCLDILGITAKFGAHGTHTFFNDALHRAAPSCVKCANGFFSYVHQQDGYAVGGLDGEQDAWRICDKAVGGDDALRCCLDFSDLT